MPSVSKEVPVLSIFYRHTKLHTRNEPFKCNSCNMSFPNFAQLKKNKIIHLAIKLYSFKLYSHNITDYMGLKTYKRVHNVCEIYNKLDGVGPIDNRPSTDKLHHFVQKKNKKKKHDM